MFQVSWCRIQRTGWGFKRPHACPRRTVNPKPKTWIPKLSARNSTKARCLHLSLRDWHFIAEPSAPASHLAHPGGCAALRIVLVTVPRVSRSCKIFSESLSLRWRVCCPARRPPRVHGSAPPSCEERVTCEHDNTYRAHPWSPFPLRRAHPGPGPHTSLHPIDLTGSSVSFEYSAPVENWSRWPTGVPRP